MPRFFVVTLGTTFGLLLASASPSEARCDCSQVLGRCDATISLRQDIVEIRTGSPQCSSVVWYVDEQPYQTTVTDGRSRERIETLRQSPRARVDSCTLCADTAIGRGSRGAGTGTAPTQGGAGLASFAGIWTGTVSNPIMTHQATFVINVAGGQVSGSFEQHGYGSDPISAFSFGGGTLSLTTGEIDWVLTLAGPNAITGQWRTGFVSGPIQLTRGGMWPPG